MPVSGQLTDGPWGRLVWSLPVGTILAAIILMAFLVVVAHAPLTPPPRNAVVMQVIELPSEPALGNAPPQPAPRETLPKPELPKRVEQKPELPKPVEPMPADALPMAETVSPPLPKTMPRPDAVPFPPPTKPKPPRPHQIVRRATPQQTQPPSQTAPGMSSHTRAPTAAAAASRNPAGGATMGARALYKPMPDLPEELRRRQLSVIAVASFHVAADGSATVTLRQATADPLINAVLMDALRKWRFFPALENGHPVASIIEIRIPIVVK